MRHLFIINPVSGTKKRRNRLIQKLKDYVKYYVKYHKDEIELYFTKAAGDGTRKIQEALQNPSALRIYVAGGDGTLNEAVQAIYGHPHAELCVIPVGTGNDFLRNFTPIEAFSDPERLINGRSIPVDLIQMGDKYSINIINIGFDCQVVQNAERIRKRFPILRPFSYTLGVLVTLIKRPTVHLKLQLEDGEQIETEYLLSLFANGAYYGGGYHAVPPAHLQDGRMNVLTIPPVSRLFFISLVLDYKRGRILENPRAKELVRHQTVKSISLQSEKEIPVCIDGEIITLQQTELTVLPGAIRFIVPEGAKYIKENDK